MTKMGRPRVDETIRKVMSIRMSDTEMEMTKKYAKEHGITVTQTIVTAVKKMVEEEAKR